MKLLKIILIFLYILDVLFCNDIGFNVPDDVGTIRFNSPGRQQKFFLHYSNCDEGDTCNPQEPNECNKQDCFKHNPVTPDNNPIVFKKSPNTDTFWFGTMSGISNIIDFQGTVHDPVSMLFYRDYSFNGVNNNPEALRFQSIDFLPPSGYNIESCTPSEGIVFTCPMFGSFILAIPEGPLSENFEECTKIIYDFNERIIMNCVVDENTKSVWVFTGNPQFNSGDTYNIEPTIPSSTPIGFIYRIDLSDDVLDHSKKFVRGTLKSFNPFTNPPTQSDSEDGAMIEGWYPISATKDSVRGLIYAGGLDGVVIRIDPSKNKVEKVMNHIPGMHITKLVYHKETDSLFLGTNIGIMIDVSVDNFIMKNVFYLEGFPSITDMHIDLHEGETFLVLSSKDENNVLKLWRANYVLNPQTLAPELKVWDGLASGFVVDKDSIKHSTEITSISCYFYDNSAGHVILIPRHTGALEAEIQYSKIEIYNCGILNCNDCTIRDPLFCRLCHGTRLNPSINCFSDFVSCSEEAEGCPQAINAEPSIFPLGSSITAISIRGFYILPSRYQPSGFKCKFSHDTNQYSIVRVSENEGRCDLPEISLGGTEETFNVKIIKNNGDDWTNEVSFTVHDCSVGTCETCSSRPGCGWCRTQAKCTSLKQCGGNTDFWGLSCPSINSVQPPSAPISKDISIEIMVNDFIFIEDHSYKCIFNIDGTNKYTDAIYDSTAKTLLCNTPSDVNEAQIDSTLSIGVEIGGSTLVYSTSKLYEFYDCSQYKVCSLCIDDSRSCEWCSDTQECKYYDENSSCSFDEDECSLITEVIPNAVHIDDIVDFDVVIKGDFSIPGMKCILKNEHNTIDMNAELNNDQITCKRSEVISIPLGNYKLYIADSSNNQYSNDIDFIIYDCSETTCIGCVGSSKTLCRWSHNNMICEFNDDSSPPNMIYIYNGNNCPRIQEVTPSIFNNKESTDLVIKGSFGNYGVLDEELFACRFGTIVRRDSFKFINSNTASCTSPSSMKPGEIPLAIYYGSKQYTNNIPIESYSCELISTSNCLDFSCSLCAVPTYSCTHICNPVYTIPTRPSITEVTPSGIDRKHNEMLIIKGGPFVLEGENVYFCRFISEENIIYGTTFATRIDSSTLNCLSVTNIPEDQVKLEITYTYEGQESTYISTTLDIYECNAGEECTDSNKCLDSCISDQPHCGWCYKTNSLTSRAACELGYWVKECPKLDGPKYLYSPTKGGEEIKITLNVLISAMVSEYESNNARDSPILCNFADLTSEAIPSTSGGKTHISCISPAFETQTTMTFLLTWNDIVLIEDVFEYANCNVNKTCAECPSGTSVCGTCFQLNQCGYPGACVNSNYNFSPTCPSFLGVQPDSGSEKGGTEVILLGSPFYENMVDIEIYFGEELASNVTYINETAISVLTPKNKPDPKGTEIKVYVNGKPYFTTTRSFTYTKEVSPVPIILGVLFGLVLPISAVIVTLAFMKKKKLGIFKVHLKEPDYLEVIFGKHLKPLYKMPKDRYAQLEEALMDDDPTLVLTISAAVQPTDHDKLARAFAELFYSHDRLKEYMILFINDEVQRQLEENTVFRGNTIASKLFQLFSKIVGTKFLWNKIARLINELDQLGEERLKKEASKGLVEDEVELEQTDYLSQVQSRKKGGQSVFKVEMEVDPTRIIEDAIEEDAMDAQANAYQLILTCQKIWGTLVKSLKEIPDELREVFIVCKDSIKAKFNSDDAVYKTIGGFLFLRFICPAFTIPHSYGLLERPPNQISQRQFVLIGKVLQNLANMVMPGIKEPYMAQLDEFFRKNIPRMQEFYIEILKPNFNPELSEKFARPVKPEDLPRTVVDNALAEIWSVVRGNKSIREYINETYKDDKKVKKRLNRILDDLTATYDEPKLKKEPKKPAPRGMSRRKL